VHVERLRHSRVDRVEELPELDGPMAPLKLGEELRSLHIQRRKQRRRAVAL
jgi:hypothetical protein